MEVLDSSQEFPFPKSLFVMLSAFPCFKQCWIRGLTLGKAVQFLISFPLLLFVSQTGIHLCSVSPSSQQNVSSWRCTPITCPSCPAAGATSADCAPSGSSTGLGGPGGCWGEPGGSLGLLRKPEAPGSPCPLSRAGCVINKMKGQWQFGWSCCWVQPQPSGTLLLLALGDSWEGLRSSNNTEMEGVGYMRQLRLVRRPFYLKDNSLQNILGFMTLINRVHYNKPVMWLAGCGQGVGISAPELAELQECVSGSVSANQVTVQVTCDFRNKTLGVVPELFWTSQKIFTSFPSASEAGEFVILLGQGKEAFSSELLTLLSTCSSAYGLLF